MTKIADRKRFIEESEELAEVYSRAHDFCWPETGQPTVLEDSVTLAKYAGHLEDVHKAAWRLERILSVAAATMHPEYQNALRDLRKLLNQKSIDG